MRPTRSSTSSAEPVGRPRYLGVEVAGEPVLPPPRELGRWLAERLRSTAPDAPAPRVVRQEGGRALVEVPHRWSASARAAWNGAWAPSGAARVEVRTVRTWGTLVGGKRWLRSARAVPAGRGVGPGAGRAVRRRAH